MSKILSLLVVLFVTTLFFNPIAKADSVSGVNFEISKIATPQAIAPSGTITYAITIKNIAATNQAPQVITDTLPAGFTYLGSAQLTTVAGTQVAFAPVASGQTLTWTFDGDTLQSIPADQTIVISYQVTASSTVGVYTNTACLTTPENVCTTEQVTVTTNPNTGLVENVFATLMVGIILVGVGLKFRKNGTFEQNVLRK